MSYDSILHPVIGIDLGTTFSSISRWDGEKSEVFCPKGEYAVPSVVYYDKGKFIVGKPAKDKGVFSPENVCIGAKRLMDDKNTDIHLGGKTFSPIEISTEILKCIYNNVEAMFPNNTFKAEGTVITVPYYFRANQISNTLQAAKMANLSTLGIIQEPIAAAFSYALYLDNNVRRDENILVFDLGGGTFDVTLFNLKCDRDSLIFNTIASNGDDRLGGLDFDRKIFDYIIAKEKIDISSYPEKVQLICKSKLMEQIVSAKEKLSFDDIAYIQVIDIPPGEFLECELTVGELRNCLGKYMKKIKGILNEVLKTSGFSSKDIDKIIKIGGSSKMTIIDELLNDSLGHGKTYGDIDPDLAVSKGAAIYGAYLTNRINNKKRIEINYINVHPLGVKDDKGDFIELIPKNAELPFEKTLIFCNTEDNEVDLTIEVYQGENEKCIDDNKIGEIKIEGLISAKKDTLDIEITFKINIDQTIDVTVIQADSNILINKRF